MGLFFRKSVGLGPVRFTVSKRGLGASVGMGRVRFGTSGGRRRASVRLPGGLTWRRSRG